MQIAYSINLGLEWVMLPKLEYDTMELGLACRGHFVGDPTADCETDICPDNSDEINEGEDWASRKNIQKCKFIFERRYAPAILLTLVSYGRSR